MAPHGALHIKQKKSAKKRRFRQISAAGAEAMTRQHTTHPFTRACCPRRPFMKALDRVVALFVPCELVTLHHGEPVSRILRDGGIPVRGVASSGVVFDQTLRDGRPRQRTSASFAQLEIPPPVPASAGVVTTASPREGGWRWHLWSWRRAGSVI